MSRCGISTFQGRGGFFWPWLAAFALIFQILVGTATAQVYTLSSGNSSVVINPDSQTGMNNWTVDGQNQLNQQWFWYRVGSSGGEASIDTIGTPTVVVTSPSILSTTYANSLFSVGVLYSLVGGAPGSGASDVQETVTIQNLTGSTLPFYFFQYAYFNLGGTPNNESGQLYGMSKGYNEVDQTAGFTGLGEDIDTVVGHAAAYGEVANDNSILNSLKSGTPTTLNDNSSATGNVNWSLEWVANIAPGTYIISKDLNISGVPEPSAWSLILLGLLAGGMWKFRSKPAGLVWLSACA